METHKPQSVRHSTISTRQDKQAHINLSENNNLRLLELFGVRRHQINRKVTKTRPVRITSTVSRLLLVISIVLIWSGPPVCLGQTKKPDSAEVLKQLLAMPAPTPRGSPTPKGP